MTPDADDRLVTIAVVERPHGVRGALKVRLPNPDTDRVRPGRSLLLDGAPVRIRAMQDLPDPRFRVLHLDGVDDRDAADALRGKELCLRRSDLPRLEPGEYYHVDLIGARVERPDGTRLGVVMHILTTSVDVLEVRRPDGSEVLIPVRDPFVHEIRAAERLVIADEPEWV